MSSLFGRTNKLLEMHFSGENEKLIYFWSQINYIRNPLLTVNCCLIIDMNVNK